MQPVTVEDDLEDDLFGDMQLVAFEDDLEDNFFRDMQPGNSGDEFASAIGREEV
jgi:hypothetical protein